jgi:hypothetical protein
LAETLGEFRYLKKLNCDGLLVANARQSSDTSGMNDVELQLLVVWVVIAAAGCVLAGRLVNWFRGECSGCHSCSKKEPARDFVPIDELGMFKRDKQG